MNALQPEQANFDHFVGTLERLENNDQFLQGSGSQAFEALQNTFTLFREARDAGQIADDEWNKIETLASDRATAYRVAKSDGGRLDVLSQYNAQTSPQGDTSKDLQDWIDRERAIMQSRPDAALFRDDFDFASDILVTNKIRQEENPDGSNAIWDTIKRTAGGFAGTLASAVDADGGISQNIERWLATDPARDENFISEVTQGLGSVGGSMAVFIAGSAVTRNPMVGGTIASTAFNGMVRYNEGYRKAMELGAPEAVASKAAMYSTPAAFVDTLGDMFLAGKLGSSAAQSLRLGGATLPRNAILNRFLYNFTEQGVAQASSEVAGDLTAAAGQSVATGNTKIWEDELARAPRTAAVSFTLGGLLGGYTGIKEGNQINDIKKMSADLGVDAADVLKVGRNNQIDIDATIKELNKLQAEKDQAQNPEPPKPEPVATEGRPQPKPEPPAPGMPLKSWSDMFNVGGAYNLSKSQSDVINQLGAKADELIEERDTKERAGVQREELNRYNAAMLDLVDSMVQIANQRQETPETSSPDQWIRYAKGGEFRSREEAANRASQLGRRSPTYSYEPIKVDPGDGTAFHYEIQRRTKRPFDLTGETIARAQDIELALRDQDAARARFDEAIAEVEANNATDVTATTINKLLGLPPAPTSFSFVSGPYTNGSEAVAARQAMDNPNGVVARKEDGQWNLYQKQSSQGGVTETTPDAAESATAIMEQAPLDPDMFLPDEEDFGMEVERNLGKKARNRRRPRQFERGSVLLPDSEDLRQAAHDGAAFFRAGIQKFSDWSGEMVAKFGEPIREHLQNIWDSIKDSFISLLSRSADRIRPPQREGGEQIFRSGIAPQDFDSIRQMATNALEKAQRTLEGAVETAQPVEQSTRPSVGVTEASQRNTVTPPVSEARLTGTPETVFSRGWRKGVRDMREGVSGAAETLRNLLNDSELSSLTPGEFGMLSRILERRNLTTQDSILIEEMGEVAIAAAKDRERLQDLKKKRSQARKKLDSETLGVAIVENSTRSPLTGVETVLDVANTDQPVVLARAIVALTPAEAAYIQNNPDRPFPNFLDAYEAALDLINASTRASQVDVNAFQELVDQASQYNVDIRKRRARSKLGVLRGAINRAEANGDDVSLVNSMYEQLRNDIATATKKLEFDGINDQFSDITGKLEELPSVAAKSEEAKRDLEKRRKTATNRVVAASKALSSKVTGVGNTSETIRSAVYDAFSDIKESYLQDFDTLDVEGIADVIEQISELVNRPSDIAVFNRFATRMMGNMGAQKILDRHTGEVKAMHDALKPNAKLTPAQKFAAQVRNNPFVRYLSEQQTTKLSEITEKGLQGSFGFISGQNLLFLSDQLGAPGLIETELFGRTDSLRTRGEAKAQALYSPIRLALEKLKDPKAALSDKLAKAFSSRGLNKTATGIPLVQDLPFQAGNVRALDSMSVLNMAFLVRQLDLNGERKAVTDRLNVADPMTQWIDGGHEKGSSPNASSLPTEERERLHKIWDAMVEAAGGNTWSDIQKILTPEQEAVMKASDTALNATGKAVRGTSAVVRNTLLPEIVAYFPLHGSRISPDNMTDDEVLNARLEPGMAYAPSTLRPSSSHVRTQWTQPQTFDLQGTLYRHLAAVQVDAELTPHLYQTEIVMRKLRDYERKNELPTTSKWQTVVNGLRREHRRVAGLDVALSSMFMSGAHRGLTAVQKLLRRGVLAQVHKPIAEMVSLGWIFGNRLGWDNFKQATRDYNNNAEAFMGLMMDSGSTFMQRTGMNAADMQVIDHGSYRGLKMRPNAEVIAQENFDIRPGVWGWLEDTKASRLSNWATRMITSYGDHKMSGPAMYSLFMDKFRNMTGSTFSWPKYFNREYDTRVLKEAMLQTDIAFQKLAAPNTSGLVSALRNQSSTSALVRLAKNILFPYSHFAANEKSNMMKGLRQGFNPNNSRAERQAGFYQAVTHATGNVIYQFAMFNIGKMIVSAAGGAIAGALGDGEDDEFARRMKELGEELLDPELQVRRAIGGVVDAATGAGDPWTRGFVGWTVNHANKVFTEAALARPYDPYKDDVVFVRDTDSPEGLASYLVGPYSRLIEDVFRAKDDLDYLLDPDKKGAGPQRAADLVALLGGYTVGLPGQTTVNKILKDSAKTFSDEDYKDFDKSLKSQEINSSVRFVVERQGNTPQAMATYMRSLNNEQAMLKAIRYYTSYTKEKKNTNRDVIMTARGVLDDFRSR